MTSAFGIEHEVSKGLKPSNMAALDRVGRGLGKENWRAADYANAKLGLRVTGKGRKRAKNTMAIAIRPLRKEPLP
jgi:hypothetical protein